jgi:ABC-type nickel/cobalt efflux system permease component RcnA
MTDALHEELYMCTFLRSSSAWLDKYLSGKVMFLEATFQRGTVCTFYSGWLCTNTHTHTHTHTHTYTHTHSHIHTSDTHTRTHTSHTHTHTHIYFLISKIKKILTGT